LSSTKATDLLKDAQADGKQVSFDSAGKVKEVINVSLFVAKEIPPQVSSLQKYSGKLVDYEKSNKIKPALFMRKKNH
jgi:hypothetical protein